MWSINHNTNLIFNTNALSLYKFLNYFYFLTILFVKIHILFHFKINNLPFANYLIHTFSPEFSLPEPKVRQTKQNAALR